MSPGPGVQAARFIPGEMVASRYRVVERIGRGGMGEVYRADDLRVGQPVALKFLSEDIAQDAERVAALVAEVRLARQVSHPNVCRVHDVEGVDGTPFVSMEFVDGEDLASLLRRIGRLPPDKAAEIAREVCAGLEAIHDRGVVHRDLKPANVMIDGRGHARITDFGLAQLQEVATDEGMIVGTPDYMAPESLIGDRPPSVQSDVYSLGLLMYELFTGRRPFEDASLAELVRLRAETPPIAPSKHRPDLDPKIERVILRCLERDPERRPRSAAAVAAGLPDGDPVARALAAGETPSPELVRAPQRAEGLRPRVAWACLAGLVVTLLAVTGLSPRTRLVPRLAPIDPPVSMATRARDLLALAGISRPADDVAFGYEFHETALETLLPIDTSRTLWTAPARSRPPVVTFWYRQSATELVPSAPRFRVTAYDPPPTLSGSARVRTDLQGRLLRLDAPAVAVAAGADSLTFDLHALFRAAGFDPSDFRPMRPYPALPGGAGDRRVGFTGRDRENPPHPFQVEVVSFQGRLVSFVVHEPGSRYDPTFVHPPDGSPSDGSALPRVLRPLVVLAGLLLGAWLARRNLRAGRGDTRSAARLAAALFTIRMLVWLLGAHLRPGSVTDQLMATIAWALLDAAYAWIFYMAIEPYLRRLWPRVLTSWARLLAGRHADPRVGRDVLVGCLAGSVLALTVAAHQAAPALFGALPGRPDNVGYVEPQLVSLLGLHQQLAEILALVRSNLTLLMAFVVVLVAARLTLRNGVAAMVASLTLFVPLALPQGAILALDLGFALGWMLLLFVVLTRFGLLAAGVTLVTHAILQSSPLGMDLGGWPTSRTFLVLALVIGAGLYGFARSLGGRRAIQDPLATD